MNAIGIDLGTTNSCVGVWKNKQVEICVDEDGSRVTPSIVSFDDDEIEGILVGNAAKEMLQINPLKTIYDTKRMLGKSMANPDIKRLAENWHFELVERNGLPTVKICSAEGEPPKYLMPWEISALILAKLRAIAEKCIGNKKVRMAVIGVPANFDDPAKQETMKAAKKAGFEEVRFVTEPSAAATAYGFDRKQFDGYRLLVFDFGGGTFDVTIIQANKGEFSQLFTMGANIGGRDIDKLFFDWCEKEIKQQFGIDIKTDERRIKLEQKLMAACIRAKEQLSNLNGTQLEMNEFHISLRRKALEIGRSQFENCCGELIQKTIEMTKKALENAQLAPAQIDRVLLVGGSTRIPLVHSKLLKFFTHLDGLNETINPDQAVAHGATILAANYGGIATQKDVEIKLKEIVPLSIGVDSNKGHFIRLISRGTPIPSEIFSDLLWTSQNNQQGMTFEFYQGEHETSKENIYIGELVLPDMLKGAAGKTAVKLNVWVNENGLLEANASYNGEPQLAIFDRNVAKMDYDFVENKLRGAALVADRERAKRAKIDARAELELALEAAEFERNKKNGYIRSRMSEVCRELRKWMEKNNGQRKEINESTYKRRLKEFKNEMEKSTSKE